MLLLRSLFIQQGRKQNVVFVSIHNENYETRLCGNERLKEDFFEVCSVETTFVFVVIVECVEDDDDDVDGGCILLISSMFGLLVDGDIDRGSGDDESEVTDKGAGVIGDGRDGIENGVVGDGIPNGPG
jgi:hypothetical protein